MGLLYIPTARPRATGCKSVFLRHPSLDLAKGKFLLSIAVTFLPATLRLISLLFLLFRTLRRLPEKPDASPQSRVRRLRARFPITSLPPRPIAVARGSPLYYVKKDVSSFGKRRIVLRVVCSPTNWILSLGCPHFTDIILTRVILTS